MDEDRSKTEHSRGEGRLRTQTVSVPPDKCFQFASSSVAVNLYQLREESQVFKEISSADRTQRVHGVG